MKICTHLKKKSHLIILAFNKFVTKVIEEIETNKGSIVIFTILKSHITLHLLQWWICKNNTIIGAKKGPCDKKKGVQLNLKDLQTLCI
jgi:hypothetical protein